MRVSETECKTALVRSSLPGLDYALNPYRGCAFGCVYCYSPAVLRETRPWGEFVEVRRNIPNVLARELKTIRRGVVGVGTVTDPYQPVEGRYRLTRFCLEQLLRYDFPVSIQTKSPLAGRDLDLMAEFSSLDVGFSFSTLDESLRRTFEPRSPPNRSRLAALKRLTEAGIETWAFLGPILPGVLEEDLGELLLRVAETGTKVLMVDRLRVRPLSWENIKKALVDRPILVHLHRKALWEDSSYFSRMIDRIKDRCRQLDLDYRDAFPERSNQAESPQLTPDHPTLRS